MSVIKSLRSRILLASGIPLVAAAVLAVGASLSTRLLSESSVRIEHRHDVIVSALEIQKAVADLERGRAAYLATGSEELLAPYVSGKAALVFAFQRSVELVADEPQIVRRLERIHDIADRWIAEAADPTIALASKLFNEVKDERFLQRLVSQRKGRVISDELDRRIEGLVATAEAANDWPVVSLAQRLARARIAIEAGERGFLLTGEAEFLDPYQRALEDFDGHVGRLRALGSARRDRDPEFTAGIAATADQLAELLERWVDSAAKPEIAARIEHTRIIELIESSEGQLGAQTGKPLMTSLQTDLDALIDFENAQMHDLRVEAAAVASNSQRFAIIAALLTVGIALLLAFRMARTITRPVAALAAATRKVAEGDLDTQADVDGPGEIGELAQSFDRMVDDIRELTARTEAARAEAVAANNAKSSFLANMSHEIRTPMTAILGFSDLMLDPEIGDEQRLDCVQTIRRNGDQLLRIINDILDLSKLEAGKFEMESITVDPRAVAQDVVRLLEVKASARGLGLALECPERLPATVQSDPTRLSQILINLVSNAIKFTESGSVRIRLTTEVQSQLLGDAELVIAVIDSGRGMDSQQVERVFEPFTQADETVTREFGGTGLGLAISKRFAELLGGGLIATSRLGRGSTFELRLPIGRISDLVWCDSTAAELVVARPDSVKPAAAAAGERPLAGASVLLVEDGRDNQRLISVFLKKAGAKVAIVEDGAAAIDAVTRAEAAEVPFDVVLMDMQMPVMDGYTATRKLRETGQQLPIIAITAHAMAGDREDCLAAGCSGYETKPIKPKRLVESVRQAYRGSG